jgi:hypothetical protein
VDGVESTFRAKILTPLPSAFLSSGFQSNRVYGICSDPCSPFETDNSRGCFVLSRFQNPPSVGSNLKEHSTNFRVEFKGRFPVGSGADLFTFSGSCDGTKYWLHRASPGAAISKQCSELNRFQIHPAVRIKLLIIRNIVHSNFNFGRWNLGSVPGDSGADPFLYPPHHFPKMVKSDHLPISQSVTI